MEPACLPEEIRPSPGNAVPLATRYLRVFLLSLLAALMRAVVVLWTTTVAADGAHHLTMARLLSQGEIEKALKLYAFHPLHPLLIAALSSALGSLETSAYVISIVASSLAVVPLFFVAKELWSERVATWTVFIYALHPTFVNDSSEVLPTGLFIGLVCTVMALGLLALKKDVWWAYPLAGGVAGLCYLARAEGLLIIALAGLGGAVKAWCLIRRPAEPRWFRWLGFSGGMAVAAVVFLGFALPYALYLHKAQGKLIVNSRGGGKALWAKVMGTQAQSPGPAPLPLPGVTPPIPKPPTETVAPVPPAAPSERWVPAPGTASTGEPRRRSWGHMVGKLLARAAYWPLLPFILLGAVVTRRQGGQWRSLSLLVLAGLLFILPPALLSFMDRGFQISHRYFLPGMVFLLPWAAAGCSQLTDWQARLVGSASGGRRKRLLAVALPALLCAMFLPKVLGPRRAAEASYLEAGAWLRNVPMAHSRHLMTSSEKISYYGNFWPVEFPFGDGRTRWVLEPGGRDPGPDRQKSVSDAARRVVEVCRREVTVYLAIDDEALQHYFSPDFLGDLEMVGFERVATFPAQSRKGVQTVYLFHKKTSP